MDKPVSEVTMVVTVDDQWLTREQIDSVIESMSASDLIDALGDGKTVQGPKMAGDAFNAAAARLGFSNGTPATEHVRVGDFSYLAGRIGEVVNSDSPLSEGQDG